MGFSKPIPPEDLFRSNDINTAALSPGGEYLAIFKYEEDRTLIDLTFTDSMIQHEIISFPYDKTARLLDLEWLDATTILIDYKHKSSKDRRQAILPIKFKDDGTPYTKAKRIWAKGYIVDNLIDKPGTVLFAQNDGSSSKPEVKLYYADYKTLMDNKVAENAKLFPIQAPSAFMIFSSHSDKELLSVSVDFEEESVYIYYLTEGMKEWQVATTVDQESFNFNPIGILDEHTLAVLSNDESDLTGLYKYDLKTKNLGELIYAHPKYDLLGAKINPKTKLLETVAYLDHGQLVTKFFSKTQVDTKAKLDRAFPNQQLAIVGEGKDSQNALVFVFSSDNPGQYYLFDKKNSKAELVGELRGDLDKNSLSEAQNLTVLNNEGQELESILTRPKEGSNGVLIVNPHGGPIGVRDAQYFDRQIQFLTSRGYTVLQVNFRGSEGFGKKFLEAGIAQFGKAIEEDISSVVDHVIKTDSYQHVCAMGTSYGGYSSVMLAIKHPDVYDCVIAAFGVYDLPLIFNSRNIDDVDGSIESYEQILGRMRKELWDYSPLYQADKLEAPTLLIAGYEDEIAPIEQSNRFKMRLEQLNKPLETLFYKKSGHGHHRWYDDIHHNLYVDDFIRRTLGLPPAYTEDQQELLIDQYKRIADGLDANGLVDRRGKLAMKNYKLAGKLGHARSQFNVASFYHRGEAADKDLNEAARWYKLAAENDYNNGNIRLAHLHRRGVIDSASHEKAIEYFKKAATENSSAKLYLARAYCFGEGVVQDIPQCFEKLSTLVDEEFEGKKFDKPLANAVHEVMSEISWRLPLDSQQISHLKDMLEETSDATLFTAEIEEEETGLYLKDSNGYYSFEDSVTTIPLEKGASFGTKLKVSIYPRISKYYGKMIALKARWTNPIAVDEDGAENPPYHYIHFTRGSGTFHFIREIDQDWKMVPGKWTLELATFDGETVFKQEFDLQPESVIRKRKEESGLGSLF
ncbi:prolyl oligopeptidase family serine peptidase [Pseudoteredinibacter isoporae]|uniref:Prolyl oligopeptidase PreP (S9A serine peptidase family) n=1 Tax=Pseudoteredinibacter isoporae TaxID=570281 RepID=A0A7X0JU22_9GAMM|nr:prolyl oligopeptidase family serine peptidase [Pseudoteredinibacter isoporae]MBB6522157.1 prolyl oligopeptidase PreP (S9A serine peptidase family) [Pseudoteredinibacter isoporae]NHO87692.1 prolyl oligopeptidase family serine peptidase [Pseudoteredinibacter isoporae]NIB23977.1 prolyl oligopeptidase family serine peptidase [Pseudoteredinibacter isoporae]